MTAEPAPGPQVGFPPLFAGASAPVLGATEGQLVARFAAARDEAAFEAIVRHHGPMVLRVCRAAMADPSDADDAFQATFLVLARRAGSFRAGAPLAPWLHGIARRVARRAEADAARRRRREAPDLARVAQAPDPSPRSAEARERAALLHAEVDRLPSPERTAVVLCDLEGLTHQEAADQLGWPLGTVKSRVLRGRERLRARLVRRGVALSAPALVVALAGEAGAAPVVARGLGAATARGAVALLAGRSTVAFVSPLALDLARRVARTMIWTKLKAGAAVLAATTLVAAPPLIAHQGAARPNQAPAAPQPAGEVGPVETAGEAVAGPGRVYDPTWPVQGVRSPAGTPAATGAAGPTPLQARMVEMARSALAFAQQNDSPDPVDRLLWSHRLAEADGAASRSAEGKVKAVQDHLDRLDRMAADQAQKTALNLKEFKGEMGQVVAQQPYLWDSVAKVEAEIAESRRWRARVLAESTIEGPAPPVARAEPSPASRTGGGFGGTFGGGGTDKPEGPVVPPLPKASPEDEKQNQAILALLERRVPMKYPNDTPLSDVLKHVRESTKDKEAGFPDGIPIYVDRQGLQDADKTESSTVAIDLEGIALRTTLQLTLRQLGLTYIVENGLLIVINAPNPGDYARYLAPKTPAPAATPGGFR